MSTTPHEATHEARLGAGPMFDRDRYSASLGMRAIEVGAGRAVVRLTVRDDMLNGFDVVHGGVMFSLADTAFAIACNESNEVTLASGADIAFLRPVMVGEELTATAERRARTGRSGLYDIHVAAADGTVVAEFRGRSRTTNRPVPTR